MTTNRCLVDTDILVDYLRGHEAAADFLEAEGNALLVSVVTIAELYAGCREEERYRMEEFLEAFEILPLDAAMATRAGGMRFKYGKSHGTGLADAMIAATAETAHCPLATLNRKHFPMLKSLVTPYKRP